VFKSAQYGNVLVLDGVIQLTERDEFAYHEMMVHLPLCSHRSGDDDGDDEAKLSVLVVGGGDGGAVREVCRYKNIEKITLVEIDPLMIEVAKKYFADTLATCLDDPRVEIVHEDAAAFLQRDQCREAYDVIIGDTSDPVGPAKTLFQPKFYEAMYEALRPNGIVCVQAECFWIHLDLIEDLVTCCDDIFDDVVYASTMVPTYPCGQIGFIMAGKSDGDGSSTKKRSPFRSPTRRPDFLHELKWYSPQMHRASMTLPPFVQSRLQRDGGDDEDEMDGDDDYRCFLANPSRCAIL